jgi:hypothetical protein
MKNEKGFTLLEVVVSIFAIACMSTFIIRMFLVSAQVNQTAYYRDHAAAYAMQIMETFKSGPYGEEMLDYFGETTLPANPRSHIYYDAAWQETDASGAVYALDLTYTLDSADIVELPNIAEGAPLLRQGRPQLSLSINKVEQGEERDTLISYQTSQYARLPEEKP